MLMANKTIKQLTLWGEEERCENDMKFKKERMTENEIGDEGAKALSETLRGNTSLTYLDLESEEERIQKRSRKERTDDRQWNWE